MKSQRSRKKSSRSKMRSSKEIQSGFWYGPYRNNLVRIKPYFEGTKKGFRGLEELETLPRKNQAELDSSEKERFVSALKTIIKNGQYAEL